MSTNMNNSYLSPSSDDYSSPYCYSTTGCSLSGSSTYFYSPTYQSTCPAHTPYIFYTPTPSTISMPPVSYGYSQYEEKQSQMLCTPRQSNTTGLDRTPLRRHRCFKKDELQILHQAFNRDPHPGTDVLEELAIQLKVSIEKVRQWFKNRRHSEKQKKRSALFTEQSYHA